MRTKRVRAERSLHLPGRVLLRLPQVVEKTGLSRSSVYRLMALGEFPEAIKIGRHASAWDLAEVDEWIDGKAAGNRMPAHR